MTRVSLIVAMGTSRVIGNEGEIPWNLPADLAYFKKITMGQPIVMGRKTYESIGRPLPGRRNIVLSRTQSLIPGVELFSSVKEVIEAFSEEEIFIIGGGQIYETFLSCVETIYLTEVAGDFQGDAFFPELDLKEWEEISRRDRFADEKNQHDCCFRVLKRVSASNSVI